MDTFKLLQCGVIVAQPVLQTHLPSSNIFADAQQGVNFVTITASQILVAAQF